MLNIVMLKKNRKALFRKLLTKNVENMIFSIIKVKILKKY